MEFQIEHADGHIIITGDSYRLRMAEAAEELARAPYAELSDNRGSTWSRFSLLASASVLSGTDESIDIDSVTVGESEIAAVISIVAQSSLWSTHVVEMLCDASSVGLRLRVAGQGLLDEVMLLGGEATLPGGACGTFRSSIGFASVLVPSPTEPVQFARPAHSAAILGVVGDADPGRLNGIYSPPPLVLGLTRSVADNATTPPDGEWCALSVREAVQRLTFTTMAYDPLDGGFVLRFRYEGHTSIDGEWTSPTVVFLFPESLSGWDVVDAHRADLEANGYARQSALVAPDWWREPLFCGWGAQSARSAELSRHGQEVPSAPDLASADLYDELLLMLGEAGIEPGIVVIDDRWQKDYGTATPDLLRWPDLKGWIAAQHAVGRRVLLWWKAWDPAGIPLDECVVDAAGRPVSVDAANPAYLRRLADIVHTLISPEGMDADGFKVDFTQRSPSGRSLTAHEGVWGIAALHTLLATIHRAAHQAKADALVVTHAVHPSFADVSDMTRLNDVLERDVRGARVSVVDQLKARHAIAVRSQPSRLIDTDQWPMPSKAEWLDYADAQAHLGVPALYYAESIDNSGEKIERGDLARIAASWKAYRVRHGLER